MEIEIKRLTVELLNDWLHFFDHIGFSDNAHWSGCYCMCYHWDKQLIEQFDWNTEIKKGINSNNRENAIKLIKNNVIKGYLAYNKGGVVGWCNTNDKKTYKPVSGDLPSDESEKDEKIKAIVCFSIAPELRNKGIASLLLNQICSEALADGYEYIEAYPFSKEGYINYHGPLNMYLKNGFSTYGENEPCIIVRKYLK